MRCFCEGADKDGNPRCGNALYFRTESEGIETIREIEKGTPEADIDLVEVRYGDVVAESTARRDGAV